MRFCSVVTAVTGMLERQAVFLQLPWKKCWSYAVTMEIFSVDC